VVAGEPTILHADLDAFYASVEQRDDQGLRGRPTIVGAGVVLSASYEARALGVRTPMGLDLALRLCPDARVVSPRFEAYSDASKQVFEIFDHTTPLVEGLSIDEAFLDVRGMERIAGTPTEMAVRLRQEVRTQVGLPITVGVARTKHLAKVASGVAKPDGLLVVPLGQELDFLHPLNLEHLWGCGPVTARKLHLRGITIVRELAKMDAEALCEIVGKAMGHHLHALANDRDPRPVQVGRRRHSIGSQRAMGLGRFPRSPEVVDANLLMLVDRVTRRMRAAHRVGRTVVLRMRFEDFSRATRSRTLAWPTAQTHTIVAAARELLAATWPIIERQGLTMVGVSVSNLDNDDGFQMPLPFDRRNSGALDAVLDKVRERFGSAAVTRASLLGRDDGLTMPMLPD
jgi:DNA polymerase IV